MQSLETSDRGELLDTGRDAPTIRNRSDLERELLALL
jgi:hypothetical protein